MGKGDKKSKRGKIIIGSYGVSRKRKKCKATVVIKEKKQKVQPENIEITDKTTVTVNDVIPTETVKAKRKAPAKKDTVKKAKKETTEKAE